MEPLELRMKFSAMYRVAALPTSRTVEYGLASIRATRSISVPVYGQRAPRAERPQTASLSELKTVQARGRKALPSERWLSHGAGNSEGSVTHAEHVRRLSQRREMPSLSGI